MQLNDIVKKTKILASPNRYSALADVADDYDNDDLPESHIQEPSDTTTHAPMKVSLLPPIFIKLLRPTPRTYGVNRSKQLRM